MNKKRRCTNCKKYELAENGIIAPIGFFCCDECRKGYGINKTQALRQKTSKRMDKEFNKRKRKFYDNDLKTRKEAAKKACHAYIRYRDKGKGCITCDRPLAGKYDAGHFLKSTHSYTKFMEKNIHGQCVYCNQYNGGREKEYRMALIELYGLRTVEALECVRSRFVKRTAQDYKAIEEHYKNKLKMLKCESD